MKPATVVVTALSDLRATGTGVIRSSGSALQMEGRRGSCDGTVTSNGTQLVHSGGNNTDFVTDVSGEIYITWALRMPLLIVVEWELGTYTGAVDIEITY